MQQWDFSFDARLILHAKEGNSACPQSPTVGAGFYVERPQGLHVARTSLPLYFAKEPFAGPAGAGSDSRGVPLTLTRASGEPSHGLVSLAPNQQFVLSKLYNLAG